MTTNPGDSKPQDGLLPAKNQLLPNIDLRLAATLEAAKLGLPCAHKPRSNRTRNGSLELVSEINRLLDARKKRLAYETDGKTTQ